MKSLRHKFGKKYKFHQDNQNQVPRSPREEVQRSPNHHSSWDQGTVGGVRPQPRSGAAEGPYELHLDRGKARQQMWNGAVIKYHWTFGLCVCVTLGPRKGRESRERKRTLAEGDVKVLGGLGNGKGLREGCARDAEVRYGCTGSPGLRRVAEHEVVDTYLLGERKVVAGLWEAPHNLLGRL